MKVFISGSKYLNGENKNKSELRDSILTYLDDIIEKEASILIGDCMGADELVQKYLCQKEYKDVTIYVSGSKGSTRINIGRWTEKHFRVNGRTPYAYRMEKDLRMAEDADCGIALWDGKSKGTYINMLCMVAQGKLCKLYLANEDRWQEIDSIEMLGSFAGEEGKITADIVREVMEGCGFSEEMIAYSVSKTTINPYALADIICRAPIPLDNKMYLLGRVGTARNIKHEAFCAVKESSEQGRNFKQIMKDLRAIADCRRKDTIWTHLYNLHTEIQEAKDALYAASFDMPLMNPVYMFAEWYDIEELAHKSSSDGYFATVEAAEKYLKHEEMENDTGDGYYRMESWDFLDEDRESARYDFYYNGKGDLCWFEKLMPQKQPDGNTYYFPESRRFSSGNLDLDIMTPYQPGDIVLIDCRPFGPPFYAVILEAKDQWDCCFPNIVFCIPGTDEWRLTPLKHRMFYRDAEISTYEPMLSPLYRIRKVCEGELGEGDGRLKELSRIIDGSEEKASQIWENWESGDLQYKDVLRIFNQ